MTDEKILALILEKAIEKDDGKKRLPCRKAFQIAEANEEVTLHHIGRVCTENDVKIIGCQLGCFK